MKFLKNGNKEYLEKILDGEFKIMPNDYIKKLEKLKMVDLQMKCR